MLAWRETEDNYMLQKLGLYWNGVQAYVATYINKCVIAGTILREGKSLVNGVHYKGTHHLARLLTEKGQGTA